MADRQPSFIGLDKGEGRARNVEGLVIRIAAQQRARKRAFSGSQIAR
jgi:hypothetical protein